MKIKNTFFDKKLISISAVFIILLGLLFSLYFFFNKKTETLPSVYKGSTFEITVPDGWSVATSSTYSDFTVISQNKKARATRNIFTSSEPIIFINTKNVGTSTLDILVSQLRYRMVPEIFAFSFNNYKLIKQEKINILGLDAYIIENSFEVIKPERPNFKKNQIQKSNDSTYKTISLITIKNERLHVMTAFSLQENWEEIKNVFDAMLLNFKI